MSYFDFLFFEINHVYIVPNEDILRSTSDLLKYYMWSISKTKGPK